METIDNLALRRRAAALMAIAALGAAGCGGSADGDDSGGDAVADTPREQVRAAYMRFERAMAATNARTACGEMSPRMQREIGAGQGCTKRLENIFATSQPGASKPFIVSLKVNGNTALVKAKTKTSQTYSVRYVKQNGAWKLHGDGTQGS